MKLPRRWLIVAAATVLLIDGFLIATDIPSERAFRRERRERLSASISKLRKDLPGLQRKSEDARQSIFDAVDAMDDFLNLGRRADDIPRAQELFPKAVEAMETARRSLGTLSTLTGEIITRAEAGRRESEALVSLVGPEDAGFLEAFGRALSLMADIHRIYADMNLVLENGFKLYEELLTQSTEFVNKEKTGFFRNRREAAGWFTIRTEDLLPRIQGFKKELEAVAARADAAVPPVREAFERVEELVRD